MAAPLPEPLPEDPLSLVKLWIDDATSRVRNATAMALATSDERGTPSVRMVLGRGIDVDAGWLVFYTDRTSAKGRELDARPRASVVFYWESLDRQVRIDGPVTVAPDADADRYWRTRPLEARIAAVITEQTRPLASRAALVKRLEEALPRYRDEVPRPERWIGYRLWAERVELWVSQPARLHDRAEWRRTLTPVDDGFKGGPWTSTRLEP